MATFTVSGLASGIDFGALADAILNLEREPIRQLEARKTALAGKKALFNEIIASLQSLRTATQTLGKPNSLKFASFTSGDTAKFTATGSATAAIGSYQVNIQQLATATRVTSGFATQLGISASANLGAALNDSAANLGTTFTSGYFTINGTQVSVDAEVDTVQDLIDRINTDVAGVTASYDAATDRLKLSSAASITVGSADDTADFLKKAGLTNSPAETEGADQVRWSTHRLGRLNTTVALADTSLGTALSGTGTFRLNGVDIDYDASVDSLNEVISRINTKVSTVVASYDAQTDRILLVAKSTGSLGISRADSTGNFLSAAGLLDSGGDSAASVSLGQNAKLTIPGFNNDQPIYSTTNTVTGAIPGVTLELKAATSEAVSLTVARDGSDLKSKLQSFVQKYNEAIGLVHGRLTEEPVKDATSETLQRVGALRGDTLLSRLKSSLSTAIITPVDGLPSGLHRLGNLGIGISSSDYKTGTLSFDEAKFDELFETNFEAAYDILFDDTDGDGQIDDGENGAIPRFLSELDQLIDTTTQSYGGTSIASGRLLQRLYTYDQDSKFLDARIEYLEERLAARELILRARFTAAETAISQLQGAGTSLSAITQSWFG